MKASVKIKKIIKLMKIVESFDDAEDLKHIIELINEQKTKLWIRKELK